MNVMSRMTQQNKHEAQEKVLCNEGTERIDDKHVNHMVTFLSNANVEDNHSQDGRDCGG